MFCNSLDIFHPFQIYPLRDKQRKYPIFQATLLSCGMDDGQDQDNYEERLKEVFNSFDASGSGSLSPEELTELCQSLHLDDATPALFQALLQNQDHLTARVPSVIFTTKFYLQ